MVHKSRRLGWIAGALVVCTAATVVAADGTKPPASEAKPPAGIRPGDMPMKPAKDEPAVIQRLRDVEKLKLPPGAILVICREIKEGLELIPEGVLLAPEKYQAILERLEQLEKQARAALVEVPSACRLTGQVDGDVVHLQAQYDIQTVRPRTVVTLGCQRAQLKPGATIDGRLPRLIPGDDGQIKIQVEKPGDHRVLLELDLPLASKDAKGLEQAFSMGLPGAAITTLDQFVFPRTVTEVRINSNRVVRTQSVDGQHGKLEAVPLGPVDRLDLAWKGPAVRPQKEKPLLQADGRLLVHVGEGSVLTDAEFKLQVLRGEVREWRIQLPPHQFLDVKEPRPQDELVEGIDLPDGNSSVLRLRLKEATSQPLKVVLQLRQARPRASFSLGPFTVAEAVRQHGLIGVTAPPDLRLRYVPRADVVQREISDDMRRTDSVAEFSYGNLTSSPASAAPPLTIQIEEVKGAVEARVDHVLQLTEQGWQATAKISVTPVRTRIDHVDVELPLAFEFDEKVGLPAELVGGKTVDKLSDKSNVLHIRLSKEQSQPFVLPIPGHYPVTRDVYRASLDLPKPLQALDRGGQVTAVLPEGVDLVAQASGLDLPARWQPVSGDRQHTWRCDRIPSRVDLTWQLYRPDLHAESVSDVILAGRQARVRQQIRLSASQTLPRRLNLEVPESIVDRLRLTDGGQLEPNGTVLLPAGAAKDHKLALEYSFVVADGSVPALETNGQSPVRNLPVPLVRVQQATRADYKVRLWTDAGIVPALVQPGPWEEQPTEIVPDQETLPALVARSASSAGPLVLTLSEMAPSAQAALVIERALFQVVVADGGAHKCRARFLVSRFASREVGIELPSGVSRLSLPEVQLDGKKVTAVLPVPGAAEGDNRTEIRVPIEPALYFSRPVILEVTYQMPAATANGARVWHAPLPPPRLRGAVILGRIRWQIDLPPGCVALSQGGGHTTEHRWIWRGALLTPRPGQSAGDLQRWLTADTDTAGEGEETPRDDREPGLVFWQTAIAPVQLVYVPQQIWMLACSLVFLVIGLGLSFVPFSRGQLWVVVSLLIIGCAAAAVWWPDLVPVVVYGCEPGIVVLLAILGIQWVLHQRYRRQVVFLPSFTRLKQGSSLERANSFPPSREPSTVDAPPAKRESSVKSKAESRKN
jgi:hypothetical protein